MYFIKGSIFLCSLTSFFSALDFEPIVRRFFIIFAALDDKSKRNMLINMLKTSDKRLKIPDEENKENVRAMFANLSFH